MMLNEKKKVIEIFVEKTSSVSLGTFTNSFMYLFKLKDR